MPREASLTRTLVELADMLVAYFERGGTADLAG